MYYTMDIKPSSFQGDFLGNIPWKQIEKKKETYDIITILETLQYIYFEEDFEHLFNNINLYLKPNGRIIVLVNNDFLIKETLIKYLTENGLILSLITPVANLLVYSGIDSEKLNFSREFEWNMFYLKILNQYSTEETGLVAEDWEISSKHTIYIFEKTKSNEIKNLQKNLNLYF